MNDKLVYIPRGRDPLEDLNLLADCVAALNVDLFDQGGAVVRIDNGMLATVTPTILSDIIAKNIVLKLPMNPGTGWEVTFPPCQPDDKTLRALLMTKTLEEGSLACRLPKVPSEPHKLTPQQQQEVQVRLKTGESYDSIARSYGVDVATIRQLGQISR
jgi:hypothetical protein